MNISRRVFGFGLPLGIASFQVTDSFASERLIDKNFRKICTDWLENYFKLNPVLATQIGFHKYDDEIDNLSKNGINKQIAFCQNYLAKLDKINRNKLSRANQIDYAMLENALKSSLFNLTEVKEWQWNPLYYHSIAGGAVYNLMAREFAPANVRANNALKRFVQIPATLEAMRKNIIISKVPPAYARTYASQFNGLKSTFDEMVMPIINNYQDADKIIIDVTLSLMPKIMSDFAAHKKWIDEKLVPNAKGDFRVGAKIFDKALSFTLMSNLSRAQIKAKALSEIKIVRTQMYEIAHSLLNPDAPFKNPSAAQEQNIIKSALEMAASERPKRNELVETSTNMTEFARKFVVAKDLITLPKGPVKVILMPEFQRGYAVAYCDSPGPLDKNLETYYAVSPVPDDWDEKKSESFLKEYNLRGIQDIAVHEAMPGHYVQLYHGNTYPSILRAVLSSGSFVEGWAVYAERLMIEEGFKADDPLYKLTQLKVYLRTICNALIDQAIHCENMNEDAMMELLTQTAFQEESEARGKWRRAQLSYTQLSTYFVGFLEHFETRQAYKIKMGAKYNLKQYNDGILSFGAPPVKFARAMLLDEKIPN
jgi:uncharacterized protein (DUF885 family)